jgi:adenylate kinase
MLREAVAKKTELGVKAKQFMEKGELVPDQVVIGLIAERLKAPDCKGGYILDGFPRTIAQANALDALLKEIHAELEMVISLEVADEPIVERGIGRRTCKKCGAVYHIKYKPTKVQGACDACGGELFQRPDDVEATIRQRLSVYHSQTSPLKEYYDGKGLLRKVEGQGDLNEIYSRIKKALAA